NSHQGGLPKNIYCNNPFFPFFCNQTVWVKRLISECRGIPRKILLNRRKAMKIVTLTSTTICTIAMLISSVGTFAGGGKQVGPPNGLGKGKGGKTNRTG
ncbi:MAG: hypothetical protein QF406_13850, partial [Verrucomicrobiota bacterium]|nr:hypothetical protein [Verrucomicrobiota bacterium]